MRESKGVTFWLTGLSGAGKTTVANEFDRYLLSLQIPSITLDGDVLRHGLNNDLGFSFDDRKENIRRTNELSCLLNGKGFVTIVSVISPYACDRQIALQNHKLKGLQFFEVFVDAPLEVCELRDPKGHYKKARKGEIQNFTGISAPYEKPANPSIHIQTHILSLGDCVKQLIDKYESTKTLQV